MPEAAREGIEIEGVEVVVEGEFGGVGEPARNVSYSAKARARKASEEAVRRLLEHTERVAEVQNGSGIAGEQKISLRMKKVLK